MLLPYWPIGKPIAMDELSAYLMPKYSTGNTHIKHSENIWYIYICHVQSIYLRCCWIQYESLNSAPINGYYGEWPILVRHLWIAQLYMDPLFGCAIWSNCVNSPIARDIYINTGNLYYHYSIWLLILPKQIKLRFPW